MLVASLLLATPLSGPRAADIGLGAPTSGHARLTLVVNRAANAAQILDQENVGAKIIAAEAQDLNVNRAFGLECYLPPNAGLVTVAARVDGKYRLIPLSILEYKKYDPSYIKLELDELYLDNMIENLDDANHIVTIDFVLRAPAPPP